MLQEVSMRLVPFRSIVESAVAEANTKHLTGEVLDFSALTKQETLEQLDKQHQGIFAFLAFHPIADDQVRRYVDSGSVPDDSGAQVLVLFTVDEDVTWGGQKPSIRVPGIEIQYGDHPAYQIVRQLYEGKIAPSLPGILLFESFVHTTGTVYVSLGSLDESQIRNRLRKLFELAAHVYESGPLEFAGALGVALTQNKIPYLRSEPGSLSEWLAKAWRLAWEHKKDIVTVLKPVGKALL
jgi:hypothetical protein